MYFIYTVSDSLLTTHPLPYVIVEDQNFALFNYVNELNGEMELVQEQIKEVCACMHAYVHACVCLCVCMQYLCLHMFVKCTFIVHTGTCMCVSHTCVSKGLHSYC